MIKPISARRKGIWPLKMMIFYMGIYGIFTKDDDRKYGV